MKLLLIYMQLWTQTVFAQQLSNVALGKGVTMSTTLAYPYTEKWFGDRIVDGNISTKPDSCKCCASTKNDSNPWITIDLHQYYKVVNVVVRGRSDRTSTQEFDNLKHLELYVGDNTSTTKFSNSLQWNTNKTTVTAIGSTSVRQITLKRPRRNSNTANDVWYLVVCEVEVYADRINIARKKPVTMSTTISGYSQEDPSNAVDGLISNKTDACDCCTSTKNEQNPWMTVDLQHEYLVTQVIVRGRIDGQKSDAIKNLEGLNVFTRVGYPGDLTQYHSHTTIIGGQNSVIINVSEWTRFVKLTRPPAEHKREWYLIVCEIEIYIAVCTTGHYGRYGNCNETCGQCLSSQPCDDVTGYCRKGCDPGYTGDKCDQMCADGYYGNCSQACGNCTSDIKYLETHVHVCDKVTGTCTNGCEPGYMGEKCDEECADGNYGNCSQTCGNCYSDTPHQQPYIHVCDKVSGRCRAGCEPGYMEELCDQECPDGYYGNCTQECDHCSQGSHSQQLGVSVCDKATGRCNYGCEPGYKGNNCSQECPTGFYGNCSQECGNCHSEMSCNHITGDCKGGCAPGYRGSRCDIECENGTYGDCKQKCHCLSDVPCDPVTGQCPGGECEPGYTGQTCNDRSLRSTGSTHGPASTVVIAASVSAGVVILAIVAAVLVVYLLRRKRPGQGRVRKSTRRTDESEDIKIIHGYPLTTTPSGDDQETNGEINEGYSSTETEKRPDYYSFDTIRSSSTTVMIKNLWEYIKDRKINDCERFFEEYESFPSQLQYEHKVARRQENKGKNRYREIVAYDHSRVKLQITGEGQTDYINANYVDGYERVKKFVASQGPTKAMMADFWRMVWQLKSTKIVMLTNIIEMGKEKCDRYWPEVGEVGEEGEEGEEAEYGDVTVRLVNTKHESDFNIRELQIKQGNSQARQVTQFHFKSWPDKDVPDSAWCLVNFWRKVNENQDGNQPVIVHCSAGVGRTGTFIGLDLLYEQAWSEGVIRPIQTLETLRRQRVKLVQTKEQYVFLHEAVAEALLLGTHYYWPREVPEVFSFLQETQKDQSQTGLQLQFKLLCDSVAGRTDSDSVDDHEYGNVASVSKAECDEYRPSGTGELQPLTSTCRLNNYKDAKTFIVTLAPTEYTLDDFWARLRQHGVKTIINVGGDTANTISISQHLGTDEHVQPNKFKVSLVKTKIQKGFTVRTFTFTDNDRDDSDLSTVKQYDLTCWKDDSLTPDDTLPVILLLEELLRWQSNITDTHPVVLYCRDDLTKCGLMAAILNETLRMRNEDGHVNIVDTVMSLKRIDERFVPYDEYQFLYEVIISHIKRSGIAEYSGVYSNI